MLRKTGSIAFLLLIVFLLTEACADQIYQNQRYGFHVSLPDMQWRGRESANGDGCVFVSSDGNVEVRVYGTTGYAVLGEDIGAAYTQEQKKFTALTRNVMDHDAHSFTLQGMSGESRFKFLKCFFGRESAYIAIVEADTQAGEIFEQTVKSVNESFVPGK